MCGTRSGAEEAREASALHTADRPPTPEEETAADGTALRS